MRESEKAEAMRENRTAPAIMCPTCEGSGRRTDPMLDEYRCPTCLGSAPVSRRFLPCTHDWVRCSACRRRVLTGSEDRHRCVGDSGRTDQ